MHKLKIKQIREIRIIDLLTYFFIPLLSLIALWIIYLIFYNYLKNLLILFIIISYILLRFIALGSILMYKAFAPLDVRGLCRFEPTCSTYAMIAIKKYGLIIGCIMSIKRIRRCHYPNGGIDYPQLFKKRKKEQ